MPKGKMLQNPYEIYTFRSAYQKVVDSMGSKNIVTGKSFTQKAGVGFRCHSAQLPLHTVQPQERKTGVSVKGQKEVYGARLSV